MEALTSAYEMFKKEYCRAGPGEYVPLGTFQAAIIDYFAYVGLDFTGIKGAPGFFVYNLDPDIDIAGVTGNFPVVRGLSLVTWPPPAIDLN